MLLPITLNIIYCFAMAFFIVCCSLSFYHLKASFTWHAYRNKSYSELIAINMKKMNKITIIILLTYLTFSCSDTNQSENTIAEIESLRAENDSLRKIVADIETKYVFDSISFREIYGKDNKYERNAEFNVELLVVGYNPNKSYFVKFDSIVDGKKINPDTLKQSNGGFKYKTKLTEKENIIRIDMNVENEYGQKKMGTLLETIRTKN